MNKIHKLGRTRSNPFGMPLLAILIFLGTCQSLWAQVAVGYTFASTSGTYAPIAGGVNLAAAGGIDDEVFSATSTPALPGIGFTFNYNGLPYTTCSLSANGWIFFGAPALAGLPISSATASPGGISVFGKDLVQRDVAPLSELRVETVGTAPNREYVIQFSNWGLYTAASNNLDVYNFQMRLQENGSKIVFSYGNMIITSATAADGPVQVGLRGSSNADFNNRAVANTGTWAASTAGTTNAANAALIPSIVIPATPAVPEVPAIPGIPATPITPAVPTVPAVPAKPPVPASTSPGMFPLTGLTYTWTPTPCTAVPATSVTLSSLPLVSSLSLACAGVPFTLRVSASNLGNTFQWQSASIVGGVVGTYANVAANGNAPTYTAIQTVPTAYRCIIACGVATPVPTPTTSTAILVGMNQLVNCYCVPVIVPNVACITNVTLGNINNTTTCANNVNQVATNTGVNSFPSNITTGLAQGTSPAITVSTSVLSTVAVWVDFNANGVYEASEFTAVYTNALTGTINIAVPPTATVGLTKMRVRSRAGANALAAANACSNFAAAATSGEIEDYWMNISPAGCTPVVLPPTASLLSLTKDVALTPITVSATGGAGGATYAYALTGGILPVGVTFNAATGVISGTPTTVESGVFTISATSNPGVCQGAAVYRFNVNAVACTAVVLSASPAATVGAYSFIISKSASIEFTSTGGLATASGYVYSISAGALPSGILLNATTGLVSGTPNTAGVGTFSITSTSIAGNCSITVVYTFTTACPTVVLSPAAGALTFKWNNDVPAGITATGDANYIFAVSAGALPTGLSLTTTGGITGRPTVLGQIGTFTVSVSTVTVGLPTACLASTAVYTFTVICSDIFVYSTAPEYLIIPQNLIFTKGLPIQPIRLAAIERGIAVPLAPPLVPYTFTASGLPAGLSIVFVPATTSPATYTLSGTPTTAGTGTFVITATNPNAITVSPAIPTVCTGTSTSAFTVIDNPATSLDQFSNSVKVYPNPSKGEFNVDFNGIALGKATIRIYDAQGKQVYSSSVNNNQMTISLENFSSGIYLMEVDSAKGRILKRLAKQ